MGTEFLKIKECDEAIDIIQELFDENLKPQSEEIDVGETVKVLNIKGAHIIVEKSKGE